ncbi:MAG: HindIII family type II restriction endonuclease [Bacteroides sp.]|nr:HindIII family type II restriction endonuclease [Bacteroides sp.]
MTFEELKKEIYSCCDKEDNFVNSSKYLQDVIFNLSAKELLPLVIEIGSIPEEIGHDSKEEKLFTKTSDLIFAKALNEMGLTVEVLATRSDCADIVAQSRFHNYSLVGDAKSIRLSRTAKNAKDFKVNSMVHWRGDCDYSVLLHPYFQYPKSKSQIYQEALNGNVCLFSWEYLYIMLREGLKEDKSYSLKDFWNQSGIIAAETLVSDGKKCFLSTQNTNIQRLIGISETEFNSYFDKIISILTHRSYTEIDYWEKEKSRIKSLNREEAINELLASVKLDGKISTIRQFINQIQL